MSGGKAPSGGIIGTRAMAIAFMATLAAAACTPAQRGAKAPTVPSATVDGTLATTACAMPKLSIGAHHVTLDDRPLADLPPGVIQRVDSLFRAFHERSPASESYELNVEDDVDAAELKSVVFTSAFAGARFAELKTTGGTLRVTTRVPRAPSESAPPVPNDAMLLVVRSGLIELWREHAPAPQPIATVQPENVKQAMALECRQRACDRFVLLLANDTKFATLRALLPAILAATANQGRPPEALLWREEPDTQVSPPKVKIGATTVSGRLPPEQIQGIVRSNFSTLRTCYEAGLVHNEKLTGRVAVRFVIGRDGRVTNLSSDPTTDLPDPDVVACVLARFGELTFPKPDGGIVTVVYPIMFALLEE